LTYAEARAALAAATRQGRIASRDRSRARRALEQFWGDLDVGEVVQPIVDHAGDLAEQLALGGYDAVHLATALAADADAIATADADLIRAAPGCRQPVLDARS
jgi:predicted nucleic acid-binding protein